MMTGKVMGHLYPGGLRGTALSTRQLAVQKSQQQMQMNCRSGHTVFIPTLEGYSPDDIYNSDETAFFYNSCPHRTYCHVDDKPAGSTKRKDRLTLLIFTNMDGSDHRKLSVIRKAKNPRCLQKKYKMTVNKMAVDWYASKNAWMTGDIHHRIMIKFNNQMRKAGRHVLYVL